MSSKNTFSILRAAVFVIAATLSLQTLSFAQGRGHGRGHDRKQDVFVNGHDARDGRFDNRGPRHRDFDRDNRDFDGDNGVFNRRHNRDHDRRFERREERHRSLRSYYRRHFRHQ